MPDSRRLLVWRQSWLPGSETFIRNQIDALERWRPMPMAVEAVESPLSHGGTILWDQSLGGRLRRRSFRATRRSALVRRSVEQGRPDLVHAHFATDAGLIAPIARNLGLPLVVTVHGYDLTAIEQRTRRDRRDVADSLRGARSVVALSRFMADHAIREGASAEKVVVIPTGIPIPPDPGPRPQTEGVVRALFVGRLVEKKGVLDALAAVRQVREQGIEVELTIAGGGPLEGAVRDAVGRGNAGGVNMIGPVTPVGVRKLMSSHDVFLAPSHTARSGDSEGFGMVFLEAAAHRLPSVAYSHGGVPEAVIDGETGLLSPERDIEALTQSLLAVANSHSLRQQMGQAARDRVTSRFELASCTAVFEDHLDAIAAGA